MIELLAPAGDLERAKVAFDYGADAVYVGGQRFSLRAKASNFDLDEITQAVQYGHQSHKRLYVTVNMLPHQEDLVGLDEYLSDLEKCGVDAIIVASLAIAKRAFDLKLNYEIHLSTQLSITNSKALEFYQSCGVDRVVLARELDLPMVKAIQEKKIMDTEIFIHGGMCVNYSGRCTLSNQMTLRDANRGGCAQSCRWYYNFKLGNQMISDATHPFTMGSKDLSTLKWIEDFVHLNVSSLKIEGRMKSSHYLAVVVGTYRKLIDAIENNTINDQLYIKLQKDLEKAEGRLTFDGFYGHMPSVEDHLYLSQKSEVLQRFVGNIIDQEDDWICVELKNWIIKGEILEVLEPLKDIQTFTLDVFQNEDDEVISEAKNPMSKIWIQVPFRISKKAFLRKGS